MKYDFDDDGFEKRPEPVTTTLRIGKLSASTEFQHRSWMDERTVQEYMEALRLGAVFPPIQVALIEGHLKVMDGFHRLEAFKRCGRFEIEAIVTECSREEAEEAALRANLKHGLKLTAKDKLRVRERIVALYIEQGKHRLGKRGVKSIRDMVRELECIPRTTLHRILEKNHPTVFQHLRAETTPDLLEVQARRRERQLLETFEAHLVGLQQCLNLAHELDIEERLQETVREHLPTILTGTGKVTLGELEADGTRSAEGAELDF